MVKRKSWKMIGWLGVLMPPIAALVAYYRAIKSKSPQFIIDCKIRNCPTTDSVFNRPPIPIQSSSD